MLIVLALSGQVLINLSEITASSGVSAQYNGGEQVSVIDVVTFDLRGQ